VTDLHNEHLVWRRSTKCDSGMCLEFAAAEGAALVRDSKQSDGPRLSFGPGAWANFLADVKAGGFDRP
jgi:Domain of unknown function (DUF397)